MARVERAVCIGQFGYYRLQHNVEFRKYHDVERDPLEAQIDYVEDLSHEKWNAFRYGEQ